MVPLGANVSTYVYTVISCQSPMAPVTVFSPPCDCILLHRSHTFSFSSASLIGLFGRFGGGTAGVFGVSESIGSASAGEVLLQVTRECCLVVSLPLEASAGELRASVARF